MAINLNRFHDAIDPDNSYRWMGRYKMEIVLRCNRVIREVRAKNPGLRGWLAGGVNSEKMLEIKRQIEERMNDERPSHTF